MNKSNIFFAQIFHMCDEDGRRIPYMCGNETSFNQKFRVCDWNYNVDCASSPDWWVTQCRPLIGCWVATLASDWSRSLCAAGCRHHDQRELEGGKGYGCLEWKHHFLCLLLLFDSGILTVVCSLLWSTTIWNFYFLQFLPPSDSPWSRQTK